MKRAQEKCRKLSKEKVFGIIENPIRVAILDLLYEQEGISWSTFRKELDIDKGKLNYHLRKLLAAGLVVKKKSRTNRPIYKLSAAGTAAVEFSKKVRQAIKESLILAEIG